MDIHPPTYRALACTIAVRLALCMEAATIGVGAIKNCVLSVLKVPPLLFTAVIVPASMLLVWPLDAHARMQLQLPVACDIGTECFIQNYMDHQRRDGEAHDYTCGSLTYEGHKGTDFRVPTYQHLARGIEVRAVASGKVNAVRIQPEFKETDIPLLRLIKAGMRSACGEGLRIDHGAGWESLYCHLEPGSLQVKDGDTVAAGQAIARMGRSGETDFPHLHYELRHHNTPIDPFVGYAYGYQCEQRKQYNLWAPEAAEQLRYHAVGVVTSGYSSTAPDIMHIREGTQPVTPPTPDTPTLYLWLELYGLQPHDALTLTLTAPDGQTIAQKQQDYEQRYALSLEVWDIPQPPQGWAASEYQLAVQLVRHENGDDMPRIILNKSWPVIFADNTDE